MQKSALEIRNGVVKTLGEWEAEEKKITEETKVAEVIIEEPKKVKKVKSKK